MKPRPFLVILSLLAFPCFAESKLVEEEVDLSAVLASPYELKLFASPAHGSPGKKILITIAFTNTGDGPLWIPRDREVTLGYQRGGDSLEVLPPSACDGLKFVRVRPGDTVRYEQEYEIPDTEPGPIQVYTIRRRDISTTVEVLEKRSNKSPQPTTYGFASGRG